MSTVGMGHGGGADPPEDMRPHKRTHHSSRWYEKKRNRKLKWLRNKRPPTSPKFNQPERLNDEPQPDIVNNRYSHNLPPERQVRRQGLPHPQARNPQVWSVPYYPEHVLGIHFTTPVRSLHINHRVNGGLVNWHPRRRQRRRRLYHHSGRGTRYHPPPYPRTQSSHYYQPTTALPPDDFVNPGYPRHDYSTTTHGPEGPDYSMDLFGYFDFHPPLNVSVALLEMSTEDDFSEYFPPPSDH